MRLSAWLNAARRHEVSATDAANACESVTGELDGIDWHAVALGGTWARAALPGPGDPWGVPVIGALEAVALGDGALLVRTDRWHWVVGPHTVPVIGQGWARRNLMDTLAQATPVIEALATVGDRAQAESAMAQYDGPWPPTLTAKARGDLELARRVLVTAAVARSGVSVPSSRSQGAELERALQDLTHAAQLLLCAAAST